MIVKVMLVDDHELVRSGIASLLDREVGINIVAQAGSGEEAVDLAAILQPDVILMDVSMPGMGGVEAARRILHGNPDIKIIALSVYCDGPIPLQLLKLGVSSFISKSSPADEMIQAIHKVMRGERYLCSEVANNMAFQGISGNPESPFLELSHREAEVVTLILQGRSIKQMSDILKLSDKTINTYRYRVYGKLDVKNDIELIRLAIKFSYLDNSLI